MEWQSAYYQVPHDFSAYPFSYPQLSQLVKVTPFLSGNNPLNDDKSLWKGAADF